MCYLGVGTPCVCTWVTPIVLIDASFVITGLGRDHFIDGLRQPVEGRGGGSFANHSSSPNAEYRVVPHPYGGIRSRVFLFARQRIGPRKEVLVKYGGLAALDLAFGRRVMVASDDGRSVSTVPNTLEYTERLRARAGGPHSP